LRLLDLLGAEPSRARRPYVYAGAIHLLAASALAWGTLAALADRLEPAIAELARQYSLHWSADPLPPWSGPAFCLGMTLLGAMLASAGARLSARRL